MNNIICSADPNNPRVTYTQEINQMDAAQIWDAWKKQLVTLYQLAKWQAYHNYYFNEKGENIQ